MSPEELNRKLEFIVEYQAEFAIRQDRDHEMLVRGFDALTHRIDDLRESTARFQSDASRLVIIQSDRMDRQDEFSRNALAQTEAFHKQTEAFQRQAIRLVNLILDRLPPARPGTT